MLTRYLPVGTCSMDAPDRHHDTIALCGSQEGKAVGLAQTPGRLSLVFLGLACVASTALAAGS